MKATTNLKQGSKVILKGFTDTDKFLNGLTAVITNTFKIEKRKVDVDVFPVKNVLSFGATVCNVSISNLQVI